MEMTVISRWITRALKGNHRAGSAGGGIPCRNSWSYRTNQRLERNEKDERKQRIRKRKEWRGSYRFNMDLNEEWRVKAKREEVRREDRKKEEEKRIKKKKVEGRGKYRIGDE
jgi:hypothetical protein